MAAYLEPAQQPVGGMARVSDGDSFRLGDTRIRLLGIDAPELRQTCQDQQQRSWPCGERARDSLASLLKQGEVDCRPEGTDQYGRLLAYCTVAGQDLGAAMVRDGMAISSDNYWREEQTARKTQAGIWQGGFETPKNWRQDRSKQPFAWGLLSRFGF